MTTSGTDLANQAYYRAAEGRWRCTFAFAIHDWKAFRTCRMTPLDRVRVLLMAFVPKLLGPFLMETSVECPPDGRGDVVHTTRISKWGMTMMKGIERLALGADGRTVGMRGVHHLWPNLWAPRPFEGAAEIDPSATRAYYTFSWFGTTMNQTGEAVGGGTTLTQETAWCRGVQHLERL